MPKPAVIFLNEGPWRVATWDGDVPVISLIETGEDTGLEERITETCEALHQRCDIGAPVLLAVPSTWCASSSIPTDGLPRKDRHAAMAYRLEEMLPVAEEQFSAGFILSGAKALGVCVILDKIRPITEALEAGGVYIHSITPTALLVAQDRVFENQNNKADVLIWRHDGWCDTITLNEDRQQPASWTLLPDDPKSISLHFNMMAIHGRESPRVMLMGEEANASDARSDGLPDHDSVTLIEDDPFETATRCAGRILSGHTEPWFDLKGNGLATAGRTQHIQRPMKAALAAAVFMLICLNTALLWRAHQYNVLAEDYRAQERTLYTDLFPGQTPPLAINMRLAGEYNKINGMRGKSESLPPPPATLSLLHSVLDQLPDNVRFRMMELRIEDDRVYIDGQARSHGDVGSIAKSLGGGGNLIVETRHTEQLTGGRGVSFVIVASHEPGTKQVTMK